MSFAPAPRTVYRAIDSEFYGIPIHLAVKAGESKPSAVVASSIPQVLGDEYGEPARFFLSRDSFTAPLVRGGREEIVSLVTLEQFFRYCMIHRSPRLEAFREHLSRIAVDVQTHGSHFDHARGPEAYVPAELRGTPMGAMIGMASYQAVELARISTKVDQVERKADAALAVASGEPDSYALQGWCKLHGRHYEEDVLGPAGQRLSAICRRQGIRLGSVPHRKFGRINTYPRRVLEENAPDGTLSRWLAEGRSE